MKKILVVDDEARIQDLIIKMIQSFDLPFEVLAGGGSVQSAVESINREKPDLVLLDIQMPDGSGFDVLRMVNERHFDVIFITAHEEFAIQAIKFSALDYLLKPVDPAELRAAVEHAMLSLGTPKEELQFETLQQNIQSVAKRKLVLKTQESVFVVDPCDIIRCEADRNYTSFFLSNGKKIVVSKTLKEYDTLLSTHQFFRVHQSHLINLNLIDRFDRGDGGSIVMKDGSEVPLSLNKRDLFFSVIEKL
ncbi:MAG: LytTR family DNA-binding domain-containing protein [Bacteroidota bacterium]